MRRYVVPYVFANRVSPAMQIAIRQSYFQKVKTKVKVRSSVKNNCSLTF